MKPGNLQTHLSERCQFLQDYFLADKKLTVLYLSRFLLLGSGYLFMQFFIIYLEV